MELESPTAENADSPPPNYQETPIVETAKVLQPQVIKSQKAMKPSIQSSKLLAIPQQQDAGTVSVKGHMISPSRKISMRSNGTQAQQLSQSLESSTNSNNTSAFENVSGSSHPLRRSFDNNNNNNGSAAGLGPLALGGGGSMKGTASPSNSKDNKDKDMAVTGSNSKRFEKTTTARNNNSNNSDNNSKVAAANGNNNGNGNKDMPSYTYKYKIMPGNNSRVVMTAMKRRPWWHACLGGTGTGEEGEEPSPQQGSGLVSPNYTEQHSLPNSMTTSMSFLWEMIRRALRYRTNQYSHILLNHIQRNACLVTKKGLYLSLQAYCQREGLDLLSVIPRTFYLAPGSGTGAGTASTSIHTPPSHLLPPTKTALAAPAPTGDDLQAFLDYSQASARPSDLVWILKPASKTNRGFGIKVVQGQEKVLHVVQRGLSAQSVNSKGPPKGGEEEGGGNISQESSDDEAEGDGGGGEEVVVIEEGDQGLSPSPTVAAMAMATAAVPAPVAAITSSHATAPHAAPVAIAPNAFDANPLSKQARQIARQDGYIVQAYLERPLLVKGRKFDIRCFVLVTVLPTAGQRRRRPRNYGSNEDREEGGLGTGGEMVVSTTMMSMPAMMPAAAPSAASSGSPKAIAAIQQLAPPIVSAAVPSTAPLKEEEDAAAAAGEEEGGGAAAEEKEGGSSSLATATIVPDADQEGIVVAAEVKGEQQQQVQQLDNDTAAPPSQSNGNQGNQGNKAKSLSLPSSPKRSAAGSGANAVAAVNNNNNNNNSSATSTKAATAATTGNKKQSRRSFAAPTVDNNNNSSSTAGSSNKANTTKGSSSYSKATAASSSSSSSSSTAPAAHTASNSQPKKEVKAFFFEEAYIRTSCKKYTASNYADRETHLTNDAVQKHAKSYGVFEEGNKLSLMEWEACLIAEYPDRARPGIVLDQIMPEIRRLSAISIAACAETFAQTEVSKSFELFGYDYMILDDAALSPVLIEVNTNPCLEFVCPLLTQVITDVIEHTMRMTVDREFPPPPKSMRTKASEEAVQVLQATPVKFLPLYP